MSRFETGHKHASFCAKRQQFQQCLMAILKVKTFKLEDTWSDLGLKPATDTIHFVLEGTKRVKQR